MRRPILFGTFAAALAFLAPVGGALEAQRPAPSRNFHSQMTAGIGYSAIVPQALLGASAYKLFGSSGLGIFADWKMSTSSVTGDEEYCPPAIVECAVTWVEDNRLFDDRIQELDDYLIFNGGVVYAVTPEFGLMLGGGAARRTRQVEFVETSDTPVVTETGRYYVDEPRDSGWKPQVVGGLLIRAGSRVAFRFGYETAVAGVSIGGYFVP